MPKGKSTKSKSTTKSKKSKKAAKVAEPVVENTVVEEVEETVEVSPLETLNNQFSELLTRMSSLKTEQAALVKECKVFQKLMTREMKAALKAKKKSKKSNGKTKQSGFTKPTQVSDELLKFLGKDKSTLMSRTDVTNEIQKYILANKLQKPSNKRIIMHNKPLRSLLRLAKDYELTYFNLQKHISVHFPNSKKKQEASSSA